MRAQLIFPLLLAFTACGADSVSTPDTLEPDTVIEFEAVLAQHQALNARVEAVSHRVLTANADQCPKIKRTVGFSVHTLKDYPYELQPLAQYMLGVNEGMSVRSVVSDGPAGRAGVVSGDEIQEVGDVKIARSSVADRIWAVAEAREMQEPAVAVRFLRDGQSRSVALRTEPICDYPVTLIFSDAINAHTDGVGLYITSELVRRTESDDRLALILAHELGHILLHEDMYDRGPQIEMEADAAGLALITRAGYDLDVAIEEMDRFGRTLTAGASGSHPAHEERVKALRKRQADINSGSITGLATAD